MKITRLFFIALVLYFIGNTALAQTTEHKTYDYITIVAPEPKPEYCFVSINGESYEEIKLEKVKEFSNNNEVLKVVKKYEKQGYEVFQSNRSSAGSTAISILYFLLRREHKE